MTAQKLDSILTKDQKKTLTKYFKEDGKERKIDCVIRYDDECNNNHNSFSITGSVDGKNRNGDFLVDISGGCIHEDIEKHFPEFKHLIQWHLFNSDQPMHYIANTLYHAGNTDCHGLLKGESRQLRDRKTGLLCWKLEEKPDIKTYVDSETRPEQEITLKYVPWCRIGEGKDRNFEAARNCANWPQATEDQLSLPKEELKALLLERLPELMARFRADIEELGFIY